MLALTNIEAQRLKLYLSDKGPYVRQEGRDIKPLFKLNGDVARVLISRRTFDWADNPPDHVLDIQLDQKEKPSKILIAVNTHTRF